MTRTGNNPASAGPREARSRRDRRAAVRQRSLALAGARSSPARGEGPRPLPEEPAVVQVPAVVQEPPLSVDPVERPARPSTPLVLAPAGRTTALVLLLLLAGYLVLRPGDRGTRDTWTALAGTVATAALATAEAERAAGAYLPGAGMLFSADLRGVAPGDLDRWLGSLLAPFAQRMSRMGDRATVTWSLRVVGTSSGDYQRAVSMPAAAVSNPARWTRAPLTGGTRASSGPSPSAGTTGGKP